MLSYKNCLGLRGVVAIAAVAMYLLGPGTTSASAVTVTFSSASDLNGFDQRNDVTSNSASSGLAYSATAGRSGGGGIVHVAGGDTLIGASYDLQTFNASGSASSITVSEYFKMPATFASGSNGTLLQVGLVANNVFDFDAKTSSSYLSAYVSNDSTGTPSYSLNVATKANGSTTPTSSPVASALPLNAGDWYLLSATFTHTSTASNFTYSTSLQDWGSTGAALVSTSVSAMTGTLSSPDLYSNSAVLAGFQSLETTGVAGFDDFTAATPEPSGLCLLGAMGMTVAVRHRKSRIRAGS